MSTKSQRMAQAAYERIAERANAQATYQKEYRSFAREFPTLVHQCGLAQAIAFAQAGKEHHKDYLADIARVLAIGDLAQRSRSAPVSEYVRISRDAIDAAIWLKRYVEALFPDPKENTAPAPENRP